MGQKASVDSDERQTSTAIRTVLVDDEPPARQLLRELLGAFPEIEIVGEASNGFEAIKKVTDSRPDLLFLDIQMPKLNGFEALELLAEDAPAVIFVTAYDQHALRAFEVHALDYLLKPVTAERLAETMARAMRRLQSPTRSPAAPPALAKMVAPPSFLERILIRDGAHIHVIAVHRIDYIEAQDDYISIAAEGSTLRKQQPLSELAGRLDTSRFVRIHRSYVLNIERLARLELYAKDSRIAILRDGTRLPVSRSGYARLRELL